MAWVWVLLAGVCEVGWAVGLKASDGLREPKLAAATIAGMLLSFGLLALGVRDLPIGTAYAVWTGIGAAGTAVLGIVFFGEPRDAVRLACLALIVAGIVGLKLTSRG